MTKPKKMNRRDLLKSIGVTVTAAPNFSMSNLFATLLSGIVANANSYAAESSGSSPRNFVMFQMRGAPSRWTWTPLCPFDAPGTMISNRNVITKFIANDSSEYDSGEYATVEINGVNMPWVWQFDVPTSDGGSRPMSDLMEHMMLFQGVNVVNPDHSGAQANQFRPSGISNTVTSLTGDVSDLPVPFVGMRTSPNPYTSAKQKAGVNSLNRSGNWLENLLSPFIVDSSSGFDSDLESLDSQIDSVFNSIDNLLLNMDSSYANTISSDKSALTMIKRDFGDLSSEFYNRRNKYRELLRRATCPIPDDEDDVTLVTGVNDNPVMIDGTDIRTTLQTKQGSYYISNMAEQFSIIEYCLVNGITTCLAGGLLSFSGFMFDEHSVNHLSACLTNSLWNRGFAACLLELIDILKEQGLWNNTLIQFGPEFGRKPKGSYEGSDHAPTATDVTYLGGHLKGNEFVGSTLINSGSSYYPGTWGVGANNETYGNIGLGHMTATLAALLNVSSPVTSASSLVTEEEGEFKALLGKTRLV